MNLDHFVFLDSRKNLFHAQIQDDNSFLFLDGSLKDTRLNTPREMVENDLVAFAHPETEAVWVLDPYTGITPTNDPAVDWDPTTHDTIDEADLFEHLVFDADIPSTPVEPFASDFLDMSIVSGATSWNDPDYDYDCADAFIALDADQDDDAFALIQSTLADDLSVTDDNLPADYDTPLNALDDAQPVTTLMEALASIPTLTDEEIAEREHREDPYADLPSTDDPDSPVTDITA